MSIAFRRRAISRFAASRYFLVSFSSSFRGFTMFSTKTRVACSALSTRTVSASATAFSASAFAFLTVAFSVTMATIVATRPLPSTMFSISLVSMPLACVLKLVQTERNSSLLDIAEVPPSFDVNQWVIPSSFSHLATSKLGQAFATFGKSLCPCTTAFG